MSSLPTNSAGNFSFLGVGSGAWQLRPAKTGDLRDAVGAADALHALEAGVGLHALDAEQLSACDVTGNGTVGGLDASLLLQYAVALIPQLPAATTCGSSWLFFPHPLGGSGEVAAPLVDETACTPGSIAYNPVNGVITQQNFTGLILGDCNGSWGGGGGGGGAEVGVRLGKARLGRGSIVEIAIYADAGRNIRAADLRVRYDSIYLSAHDVRTLRSARGSMVRYNVRQPGVLRIALARLEAIEAGEQPILLLRFKIEGEKRDVAVRRAGRTAITYQRVH
jgi:hypothetical protein